MTNTLRIEDILSPVGEKPVQAYMSSALQVADILEWLLTQCGPSEVWQSTFSVSDEFLRRIYFMQNKLHRNKFHLLLDLKATNKTVKLWPFLRNVYDSVRLASNHSKILIVLPEDKTKSPVAVVTSQNLTRGNRYESAVVIADPGIVASLFVSFKDVYDNYSLPLNDLLE